MFEFFSGVANFFTTIFSWFQNLFGFLGHLFTWIPQQLGGLAGFLPTSIIAILSALAIVLIISKVVAK